MKNTMIVYLKQILKYIAIHLVYFLALISKSLFNIKFTSSVAGESIGGLAASCDLFIRKNILLPNKFKVCFIIRNGCNKTLINMFKKHIFIFESNLCKILFDLSKEKLIKHELFINVIENQHAYKEYDVLSPQLVLSSKQKKIGYSLLLNELGITKNDWWVCFHVRSPGYLEKLHKGRDFSYHNYRDFSEESLHEGVKEVTDRGGYAILMSDKNKSPNFKYNNKVIQYNKNTFKSDFLDIFLSAEARFFIGSSSGFTTVPKILGTLVGVCNQTPFNHLLNQKNSLMIFKKLLCLKTYKILTYDELLKRGLFDRKKGWKFSGEYLRENHLQAEENSSKEILGLVRDMFNLIEKKSNSKIENNLKKQFKRHFFKNDKHIDYGGNIAPSFLLLNKDLFMNLKFK